MEFEKLLPNESASDIEEMPRARTAGWPSRNIAYRIISFGYFTVLLMSLCLNGLYILDRSSQRSCSASCPEPSESTPAVSAQPPPPPPKAQHLNVGQSPLTDVEISPYASVPRDQLRPLVEETSYHTPENWTAAHEKWKSIDINWGIIALPDEFAKEKGLLTSMRFPWDQTKGVYVLHGMHNLHCLKVIYLVMKQYQANEEAGIPWEHLSHCFDSIRQQLVCDADDTPRVSFAGQEGVSGIGQSRLCRNWDAYEAFAKNYTACYYRPDFPDPTTPGIDHFKDCPEGSGYIIRNDTL